MIQMTQIFELHQQGQQFMQNVCIYYFAKHANS
jgi:hypothetical protein